MSEQICLNQIQPGQKAIIKEVRSGGGIYRRFLDLGLVKGTAVECVGRSPWGDPSAFLIRGAVIAIRSEDSEAILIQMQEDV